ncbi:hypothetical protein BH11MYX3_BH11MYX3_16730 [soil metagenome]
MKQITALVTTLVLGLSSAAMAAPSYGGSSVRDHRGPSSRPFRPQLPSWTTLESNGSLARGKDRIEVSSRARFTRLKLEAARGSMFIDKVVITFANGQRQVVDLAKTIGQRSGAAMIDLQGQSRQITKITVSGKGSSRTSYSLLAV